jgi:hypothetical protein
MSFQKYTFHNKLINIVLKILLKNINMDILLELLKYTIPALVVFVTAYVMFQGYLRQEESRWQQQVSDRTRKTVLPIRLQAYERLALLLERISPESIILRVSKPGMTAKQLHTELLSSIRAEFDHNVSQQVYISNEAWELIKSARGKVIHLINAAADKVKDEATALTLSQQIFERAMELKTQPTSEAMEFLKKEMEQFF